MSFRDKGNNNSSSPRGAIVIRPVVFVAILLVVGLIPVLFALSIIEFPEVGETPRVISCDFREMIVVEAAKGHKWPVGSVSGCRCILEYKGRVWVDLENRPRIPWCASE